MVKYRLVMLAAVAAATIVALILISRAFPSGGQGHRLAGPLPARHAYYLGVYEQGEPASYQPIAQFGSVAGSKVNLAGYFSGWPETFKPLFARTALAHGAATLVQMDPTGASIARIAVGDYDSYLRAYADAVRAFSHPVVIGFGHEMNASWYSWGYGHVPPPTFVAAWRRLVNVFRQQGATNVTWMWTIQADQSGTGQIKEWWPGSRYVNWVGIDGYYFRPSSTFAGVFGPTIVQVRSLTTKPVLLSETAVGPLAGQPSKITDLFHGMAAYGTLGLVWFDITQDQGVYHQDWRIEDSVPAERSLRAAARRYLSR
jgi:mannan endo-1,4-beta-mannosidase